MSAVPSLRQRLKEAGEPSVACGGGTYRGGFPLPDASPLGGHYRADKGVRGSRPVACTLGIFAGGRGWAGGRVSDWRCLGWV